MANELFLKPILANEDATEEPMDGVGVKVFLNKLWIWGGWNGFVPNPDRNTQYSSTDGITFTRHADAPWNPCHSAGIAVDYVNNIVYKIGSDSVSTTTQADRQELWKSTDGINWTRIRNDLTFMASRVIFHFLCVGTDLYVFGGQQVGGTFPSWTISASSVHTDVWKSTDGGLNWTQIATGITHLGCNMSRAVEYYNGKFYAICCPSKMDDSQANRTYVKTCYSSTDAITWVQEDDFPGAGRQYIDLCVHNGLLYLLNGSGGDSGGAHNIAELWVFNGADWAKINAFPLQLTHATGFASFNGKLFCVCGNLWAGVYYFDLVDFSTYTALP